MKKLIIILSIAVILVIIIWYLADYLYTEPTDGVSVAKNDVEVTNDKVEMQVSLFNSSKYIIDYRYYIEGDAIYFRIRTALIIVPDAAKLGDINITIEMDTSAINKIYLIGWDKTDTKLIWERN